MIDAPPRLLDSQRRRARVQQAGGVGLLLLGALLADPDHPLAFDVCGFKYVFGLPCPTCGLTRALCHAVHLDWARSLAYHPAGPLLALTLAGWMLWSAAEAYRGQRIGERLRSGLGVAAAGAGLAISAVFWLVQLAGL